MQPHLQRVEGQRFADGNGEFAVEHELFGHEAAAFPGAGRRRIGRIEAADGGTLFMDDIDSMPLSLQTRLVRVLEDRAVIPLGANTPRQVDFRVVAAAKVDLGEMAARDAQVRDTLLTVLGHKTVQELTDIGARDSLKSELKGAVSGILPEGVVRGIYLPQFVIQ